MPIVGFNFEKLNVEKIGEIKGEINVKNNVAVIDITAEKFPASKDEFLKFSFNYNLQYEPEVGKMEIIGNVIFTDAADKLKDILKQWKKDKKIADDVMLVVLNTVLFKCNIKALSMSQDVNLPPHLQMPRFLPQKDGKSAKDYVG